MFPSSFLPLSARAPARVTLLPQLHWYQQSPPLLPFTPPGFPDSPPLCPLFTPSTVSLPNTIALFFGTCFLPLGRPVSVSVGTFSPPSSPPQLPKHSARPLHSPAFCHTGPLSRPHLPISPPASSPPARETCFPPCRPASPPPGCCFRGLLRCGCPACSSAAAPPCLQKSSL
ncbi:hypothetical protein DPEC_G00303070 [Dallia pectoralis]|uniref:Uncharacterized protein n=1 Tax=Dallia pectoralis TaxID=75939 RepID=A0ACC2FH54_DALPE|nr:hypothetical protein DPEC_G00303070 [Dallia pectoralis]